MENRTTEISIDDAKMMLKSGIKHLMDIAYKIYPELKTPEFPSWHMIKQKRENKIPILPPNFFSENKEVMENCAFLMLPSKELARKLELLAHLLVIAEEWDKIEIITSPRCPEGMGHVIMRDRDGNISYAYRNVEYCPSLFNFGYEYTRDKFIKEFSSQLKEIRILI